MIDPNADVGRRVQPDQIDSTLETRQTADWRSAQGREPVQPRDDFDALDMMIMIVSIFAIAWFFGEWLLTFIGIKS